MKRSHIKFIHGQKLWRKNRRQRIREMIWGRIFEAMNRTPILELPGFKNIAEIKYRMPKNGGTVLRMRRYNKETP